MFHPVPGAQSQEEVVTWCVMLLVREGFVVEQPGAWESRGEFCGRLGISVSKFKRRMRRSKYRPQVDLDLGPTGRLIRLRSNAVFDAWMKK